MKLEHSFRVPVGVDHAWGLITDITQVAACMPGASLDSIEGNDFTGTVNVKLGAMQLMYRGRASFSELDQVNRRATIKALGREAVGSGTAEATITASLETSGESETEVIVVSELAVTGRPAQLGRGIMNEVGKKLLTSFADCLAEQLGAGPVPGEGTLVDSVATEAGGRSASSDPINLWEVSAWPIAKRLLPGLAVVTMIAWVAWSYARRR